MLRMNYLPNWLEVVDATSLYTWRGLCLTAFSQFFRIRDGKFTLVDYGGCACCAQDWPDPPQAPPADYPSGEQLGGAFSFSWIIAKKLDRQIKNDRPPYDRIIENPESGYGYYTKAEPECGFSGDKGKPQCTHALNHYVKN